MFIYDFKGMQVKAYLPECNLQLHTIYMRYFITRNTYTTRGVRVHAAFIQQQFDDILARVHWRYVQGIVVVLQRELKVCM